MANEERSEASTDLPGRVTAAKPRRPYRSPTLKALGSVRELTLGASTGDPEGGGTRSGTFG